MKIMIADGSAVVRAIFEQNLKNYADIQIIASVSNCKKIVDCARKEIPDALIAEPLAAGMTTTICPKYGMLMKTFAV